MFCHLTVFPVSGKQYAPISLHMLRSYSALSFPLLPGLIALLWLGKTDVFGQSVTPYDIKLQIFFLVFPEGKVLQL